MTKLVDKFALFRCLVLLLASWVNGATAQNPIDDARAWLESVQNVSGSWGSATEFIDSSTVVETLAEVDPAGTPLSDGASWLNTESAANHQCLARQASALADAPGFEAFGVDRASDLLPLRNPMEFDTGLPNWPEGGWGLAPGYESDCLTTALALLALDGAGLAGGISVEDEMLTAGTSRTDEWTIPPEATIVRILITNDGPATARVRMKEGSPPGGADPFFDIPVGTFLIVFPDSGLPFTPGQNFIRVRAQGGDTTFTYAASYETPDLNTTAFAEALDYLQESQNVDGGWGAQRGSTTEFYTTLHVLLALQAYPGYDLDAERAAGLAYVLGEQLAGGGFGFDGVSAISYVTALAALNLVRSETYPFSTATDDALVALLAMQDPGGSWDTEAYHTALSMLAYWEYNQPPTADAGADQTVTDTDENGSETIALSGSLSADVDGTVASYSWSEGGIEIATGENPMVVLATGVHDITLTVKDDGGRTATDDVQITVEVQCLEVTGLSCDSAGPDVQLEWTNASSYTGINVYRDAGLIATLPGGDTSYLDLDLATATYVYTVEGVCGVVLAPGADCIARHVRPCTIVSGVSCTSNGFDVNLSWTNGESYTGVNVYRDGDLIASLGGGETSYSDLDVATGDYTYTVEGVCPAGVAAPGAECKVSHTNVCNRVIYCTSKRSSAGCRPLLEASGLPSLTGADDFFVNASQVLGDTTGFFLWSLSGAAPGVGGGADPSLLGFSPRGVRVCVYRPTYAPTASSGGSPGGCDGSYGFHFTQALMSSAGLVSGDEVFAQYVFRDPAHPDGSGLGHTRALRFTICP